VPWILSHNTYTPSVDTNDAIIVLDSGRGYRMGLRQKPSLETDAEYGARYPPGS